MYISVTYNVDMSPHLIGLDLDLFDHVDIEQGYSAQNLKYAPLTLHDPQSFLRYAANMKGRNGNFFYCVRTWCCCSYSMAAP